jgi:O-antigen ligase
LGIKTSVLQHIKPQQLVVVGCCFVAFGLCFGHFPIFMSGGAGIIFAGGLFSKRFKAIFSEPYFWFLACLFIFPLISGLYTEDMAGWGAKTFRKISFLLIGFGMATITQLSKRQFTQIMICFIGSVLIIDALTLINYAVHFAEYNEALLHSKSIVIFSNISHIYFGIILTLAILVCYVQCKTEGYSRSWYRIWLGLGIFFFISMHIVASRTGWFATYGLVLVLLIREIWLRKIYILGLLLLIGICAVPIAAYYVSPSFHNKVHNTLEDMSHYQNHQYLGYFSVSMRFEAWRTCWQIYTEHPVIGVAGADVNAEMQKIYIQHHLLPEARLGEAHNQVLQLMAGFGTFGLLLFVLVIGGILFKGRYKQPLALGVFIIFLIALGFECALESHVGIATFSLFSMLAVKYKQ